METKKDRRKRNLLKGKLRPKWWSPMPPKEPYPNKKKLDKRRAKDKRSKASRQKNWVE